MSHQRGVLPSEESYRASAVSRAQAAFDDAHSLRRVPGPAGRAGSNANSDRPTACSPRAETTQPGSLAISPAV